MFARQAPQSGVFIRAAGLRPPGYDRMIEMGIEE